MAGLAFLLLVLDRAKKHLLCIENRYIGAATRHFRQLPNVLWWPKIFTRQIMQNIQAQLFGIADVSIQRLIEVEIASVTRLLWHQLIEKGSATCCTGLR